MQRNARGYCYIVARFVFLEYGRRIERNLASLDCPAANLAEASKPAAETIAKEKLFACLEQCLGKLQAQDRTLILDYYRGEQRAKIERRAQLAVDFGFTLNALCIRACRIRTKLEACVKACFGEK